MNIRELARLEKARRAQARQAAIQNPVTPACVANAADFEAAGPQSGDSSGDSSGQPQLEPLKQRQQLASPKGHASSTATKPIEKDESCNSLNDVSESAGVASNYGFANEEPADPDSATTLTVPRVLLSTDPLWVSKVLDQGGVCRVEEEYILDEEDEDDDKANLESPQFGWGNDVGNEYYEAADPASDPSNTTSDLADRLQPAASSLNLGSAVSEDTGSRVKRARLDPSLPADWDSAIPATSDPAVPSLFMERISAAPVLTANKSTEGTLQNVIKGASIMDERAVSWPSATPVATASSDDWADRVLQLDSPIEIGSTGLGRDDDYEYEEAVDDGDSQSAIIPEAKRVHFSPDTNFSREKSATSNYPRRDSSSDGDTSRQVTPAGGGELPEGFFDDPEEDARVRGVELPSERNRKAFLSDLARLNQAAAKADQQKAASEHQQELERFREQAKNEQLQSSWWSQFVRSARARAATQRDEPRQDSQGGFEDLLDQDSEDTVLDPSIEAGPQSAVVSVPFTNEDLIERAWRERSLRGV